MLDAECIENNLADGAELLRGQYRIERQIGQGGFGVTYLARDSLGRDVVIKECFPQQVCLRSGRSIRAISDELRPHFDAVLGQFQEEAKRLAALEHPGIVGVHQVFEENDTAYMAMDLVDGVDLMTLAETDPERLSADVLRSALAETLDAISYVHRQGILHRDLAPDNLILRPDNHITLIDLGAAQAGFGDDNSAVTRMFAVKDGYSPHEFYYSDRAQNPSSDLYSIGATFHFLITGRIPPDCVERFERVSQGEADPYVPLLDGDWNLDPRVLASIDRALAVRQQDRLQSAEEWISQLAGPMPKRAAGVDDQLLERISELVASTNSTLTQKGPGAMRAARAIAEDAEKDRAEPRPAKQFVDIFGNPIDDVELYLREQGQWCADDADTATRAPVACQDDGSDRFEHRPMFATATDRAARRDGGSDGATNRSTLTMGKVLGWLRPAKRSPATSLLQT